jgi:hypothetical protein
MMDLRENGFSLPSAGHFMNVNLEEYEVKPLSPLNLHSHSLVMIRAVQHARLGCEMKTPRRHPVMIQ